MDDPVALARAALDDARANLDALLAVKEEKRLAHVAANNAAWEAHNAYQAANTDASAAQAQVNELQGALTQAQLAAQEADGETEQQ